MRVESEDGSFAVHLTPAGPPYDSRFFVFKLRIGEVVLGDSAPAIERTSVAALANLRPVDDPRVDPELNTARDIFTLLTAEDDEAGLHDHTLAEFGEGLDAYVSRAYLWRDEAIFLFRLHESVQETESENVLMARVDAGELRAIAAAVKAAHHAYGSRG